jgi:lipopolysaccharide biosynthesis regulator YciM
VVLAHLEALRTGAVDPQQATRWLNAESQKRNPEVYALLTYCYELLEAVNSETALLLRANFSREEAEKEGVMVQISTEIESQRVREEECQKMWDHDPVEIARIRKLYAVKMQQRKSGSGSGESLEDGLDPLK